MDLKIYFIVSPVSFFKFPVNLALKQQNPLLIVDRDNVSFCDIFYTKEGDEVELHSGYLRDPIEEQTGVSVILMGLRSVKSMKNGTKNEELERSVQTIYLVI